jgi:diacylglycerol kinase family enzyme
MTVAQPLPGRGAVANQETARVLFVNRRSGAASGAIRALERAASRAGVETIEVADPAVLRFAVHQRLRAGIRDFLVAGGDGTLRGVAGPLIGTDARIGLVPLGTYNRFARDAGIPLDWQRALDVALDGTPHPVDVGLVNGMPFLSAVTLGMHPALLEARERLRGRTGTRVALASSVLAALARFPVRSVALQWEDMEKRIETPVLTVSVNRVSFLQRGLPACQALDAGELHVWWLENHHRLGVARDLVRLLTGRSAPALHERTMRSVRLSARDHGGLVGIDGEVNRITEPLSIVLQRRALLVRRAI